MCIIYTDIMYTDASFVYYDPVASPAVTFTMDQRRPRVLYVAGSAGLASNL